MKFLYLLMIFVFFTCSSEKTKQTENESFVDLFNKLPQIVLPLKMQTSNDIMFNQDLQDINDSILNKRFGGRNGFERPLGILYTDSNFFVVLSFMPDDVGTPIISTYNKAGSKIDSMMIFDDKPAATIASRTTEFATIEKDYTINFIDSTDYLDSLDNVINSETIRKDIFINKQGKILIK